jgi:NAD(P)-dependent dehydrogenase (short-subunit alcohol dehydrogenase family)
VSLLIVVGYGPGISHATAERFGRQGYTIALVARNNERLADGVDRLKSSGIDARAYQADAAEPESIRSTIAKIRAELGAVSAVLWTAFRSGDVKDVLETRPEIIGRVFDVGITGFLTCVQEVIADLKQSSGASILVANGSLGEPSSEADAFAKYLNNDGVALENAAKTKLVGILAERLREFGIYVGEITIAGSVAGTATASPTAIEPSAIAETFWSMTQQRTSTRVRMAE